jgi:hypothetical protein
MQRHRARIARRPATGPGDGDGHVVVDGADELAGDELVENLLMSHLSGH